MGVYGDLELFCTHKGLKWSNNSWKYYTISKYSCSTLRTIQTSPDNKCVIHILWSYLIFCFFNEIIIFYRNPKFFKIWYNIFCFNVHHCKLYLLIFKITYGYAISGFVLFGVSINGYQSILLSFFSLLRMLMTEVNFMELYRADSQIAAIYFTSYMVIYFNNSLDNI